MSWTDFFTGSSPEKISNFSGSQKNLLDILTRNAAGAPPSGPPINDFASYTGSNVAPLSSGQLTSLAGLEAMSSEINKQGPTTQRSGAELDAEKTLQDIMGRGANSPEWNQWFTESVTDPLRQTLEQDDITRGRQFAGEGSFFSSDRVAADRQGREGFWDAVAGARGSAAMENERLRASAAGIVPSLRTQSQADMERAQLYDTLIKSQDLPRQIKDKSIAFELDNYLRRMDQENKWRTYQLGLLGIPMYSGMTGGGTGMIQSMVTPLASGLGTAAGTGGSSMYSGLAGMMGGGGGAGGYLSAAGYGGSGASIGFEEMLAAMAAL